MSNEDSVIDLVGQRYGRLVVLRRAPNGRIRGARWWCQCDCGIEKIARANNLKNGATKSCGCLKREVDVSRNTIHGHCVPGMASPTYRSWQSMIQRCTNPNATKYKRWGGRGIEICERWMVFANFLTDMGVRPAGMTLDRYPDKNGNYEPDNCRWATPKQQAANRNRNYEPGLMEWV